MDPFRRIVPFLLLPSFLLVAPMSQAAILRVSQTGDGSDGATWETAFQSIGDALTASASGDRIWVASGTYNESVTMVPGVSLFGGFRGNEAANEFTDRDWKANRTLINPKGLNKRCVTGAENVVIDGFSITGARLDGEHAGFGGGILCRSNMIVRNCDIYGNYVGCDTEPVFCFSGGGISAPSADNVLISNCFIRDNVALGEGGGFQ